MTITEITKTKKGRYSVFGDGEFLFSVHKDTFFRSKLKTGLEMTVQELEELRQQDQLLSAKMAAMDSLSRAAQSSGKLLEKLERFYDSEAAHAAVERMEELGLVDDLDYATRLAADSVNLRGYSLARVRRQLWEKKIAPEIIEQVLESLEEKTHSESDQIVKLILKKYRNKIFDADDLRRTVAAMQRRGFGYEDIKMALRRIREEELYLD